VPPITAACAADEPLKICPRRGSARRCPCISAASPTAVFDVALAQAVADRLGRPLSIQWFESKLDEDSSPQLEANALLSDGRCRAGRQLCPDQRLARCARGQDRKAARFFEGITAPDRKAAGFRLGVLAPSQPYIYSPLTVVVGPKGGASARLPTSAILPGCALPSKAERSVMRF